MHEIKFLLTASPGVHNPGLWLFPAATPTCSLPDITGNKAYLTCYPIINTGIPVSLVEGNIILVEKQPG